MTPMCCAPGRWAKVFDKVRAPSTLGTWLRSFKLHNVRQLDAVSRRARIGGLAAPPRGTSAAARLGTKVAWVLAVESPEFLAPTGRSWAGRRPGSVRWHSDRMPDSKSTGPSAEVHEAGEGLSDEAMRDTVAEQTDSASKNADTAGKDWDGEEQTLPEPA